MKTNILKTITIILFLLSTNAKVLAAQTTRFYIVLYARGLNLSLKHPSFGHEFLALVVEKPDGTWTREAMGFYPEGNPKLINRCIYSLKSRVESSYSINFGREKVAVDSICMELDSITFLQCKQSIEKVMPPRYNMFSSNCIDFVNQVLLSASLKTTPVRWLFFIPVLPMYHFHRIERLNKSKIIKKP